MTTVKDFLKLAVVANDSLVADANPQFEAPEQYQEILNTFRCNNRLLVSLYVPLAKELQIIHIVSHLYRVQRMTSADSWPKILWPTCSSEVHMTSAGTHGVQSVCSQPCSRPGRWPFNGTSSLATLYLRRSRLLLGLPTAVASVEEQTCSLTAIIEWYFTMCIFRISAF